MHTCVAVLTQVERVILARSGVLLIAWVDHSGTLERLRHSLRATFPGACHKQSNIIHTSLFRIVETPEMASFVHDKTDANMATTLLGAQVQSLCDTWTNKVDL